MFQSSSQVRKNSKGTKRSFTVSFSHVQQSSIIQGSSGIGSYKTEEYYIGGDYRKGMFFSIIAANGIWKCIKEGYEPSMTCAEWSNAVFEPLCGPIWFLQATWKSTVLSAHPFHYDIWVSGLSYYKQILAVLLLALQAQVQQLGVHTNHFRSRTRTLEISLP